MFAQIVKILFPLLPSCSPVSGCKGPWEQPGSFSSVQHLEASTPEHSRCSCKIYILAVVQKLASKSLSKLFLQARKYAIIHNSECLFKSWMEFYEDKKWFCSLQVHPLMNLKCLRAYESTDRCFRLFSTSCYIEFVKVLLSKAPPSPPFTKKIKSCRDVRRRLLV